MAASRRDPLGRERRHDERTRSYRHTHSQPSRRSRSRSPHPRNASLDENRESRARAEIYRTREGSTRARDLFEDNSDLNSLNTRDRGERDPPSRLKSSKKRSREAGKREQTDTFSSKSRKDHRDTSPARSLRYRGHKRQRSPAHGRSHKRTSPERTGATPIELFPDSRRLSSATRHTSPHKKTTKFEQDQRDDENLSSNPFHRTSHRERSRRNRSSLSPTTRVSSLEYTSEAPHSGAYPTSPSRRPTAPRLHRERDTHREHRKGADSRDSRAREIRHSPGAWRTRTERRSSVGKSHRENYDEDIKPYRSSRDSLSPNPYHQEPVDMPDTQPIQSVLDDRDVNKGRPISSIDDSRSTAPRGRGGFDRGRRGHSYHQPPPPGPSHLDTRFATPHYGTPASSFHGSPPHSASPYGSQWGGSPQTTHFYGAPPAHSYAQTPPRQHSFPGPSAQHGFYQQQYAPSPSHTGFNTPSYRGGHMAMRGGYPAQPERRYSATPMAENSTYGNTAPSASPPAPATRGGRGNFQNVQRSSGSGAWGNKQSDGTPSQQTSREASVHSNPPPPPPPAPKQPPPPPPVSVAEETPPFRQSRNLRDTESSKQFEVSRDESNGSRDEQTEGKEAAKFSFAFKGKSATPAAAKPVTDLTQKMKEPPTPTFRKESSDPFKRPSKDIHLPTKPRADTRPDFRDKNRMAKSEDRRDAKTPFESKQDFKDGKTPELKGGRRAAGRDRPLEEEQEKPKGPKMVIIKKKVKQRKPRPVLSSELKAAKSVYFRKQGNESVIGSGTYGKVYKALHVYKNELVALKKIRMEGEKDGFPVTAVREMKLLQTLRHENVVQFKETMVESNDCYMVFEYLSHDLTGLLNHPSFKLEHAHKKHLSFQLFQALEYLHRRGVLHRDLKAANILVSNTGVLKLADFGLARFYEKRHRHHYTNRVITIWYRSPELLLGETQYGPAVDIWSAACVMIEIFTRHAIFPGDGTEINQIEKIYNLLGTPTRKQWPGIAELAWFELLKPREARANVFADKYRSRLSPAAFELLLAMFHYDPDQRPSAKEVLEHPYFTSEEPEMKQVTELKNVKGDWHEFESKALRKANERKHREAAAAEKEQAKRRASSAIGNDLDERDVKKLKGEAASAVPTDMSMSEAEPTESADCQGAKPDTSRSGPESPEATA